MITNNEKALLTKDELRQHLNLFLGFGDFSKTDILFFGIEEGAGPEQANQAQRHRAEVLLRMMYVKENKISTGFLNGCDTTEGYWTSGVDFSEMREQCYQDMGYEYQPEKMSKLWRQTWSFPARILFALEEEESLKMSEWFKHKDLNKDVMKESVDHSLYILNDKRKKLIEKRILPPGLYGRPPIRISQTDWRPIMRKDTKSNTYWPYTDHINLTEYLKAFNFEPAEEFYEIVRNERLAVYKKMFNENHIPIVYSYGEQKMMIPLIEVIIKQLTGESPIIYEATIPAGKNTPFRWTYAEFAQGRTAFIFSHHFTGAITLEELEVITQQIRRIRDGQEIDIEGTAICNLNKKKQNVSLKNILKQQGKHFAQDKTVYEKDSEAYSAKNESKKRINNVLLELVSQKPSLSQVNSNARYFRFVSNALKITEQAGDKTFVSTRDALVFEIDNQGKELTLKLLVSVFIDSNLRSKLIGHFRKNQRESSIWRKGEPKADGKTVYIYKKVLLNWSEIEESNISKSEDILKEQFKNFIEKELPIIESVFRGFQGAI